jgi:nicotinate-nucleotide adenylyltransferase
VTAAVGLFGGTFDPIHIGHLAIAEDAREQLGLSRVVFIPAAAPALRPGPPAAPAEDRARMVELAIAGNPFFAIDRLELSRPGPSYTVDTVAQLVRRARAAGEPTDFTFLVSAEQLTRLPEWHEPSRLLSLCRIAAVPRPGAPMPSAAWLEAAFPGQADRIVILDGPLLAISGTVIRERLASGRSVRYLVPDAVLDDIRDHGRYRPEHRRTTST